MSRNGYDPTDTQAREEEKRELAERVRLVREQEIGDIKWLMSSPRGRRIVWRLLERAGVFQISFNTNAMQMAFNEGNRNWGNKLLEDIQKCCPEQYPVMQKEQRDGRDGNGTQSN